MRPFHLVDLYSQMPYLPDEMRDWPRERVLVWMGLFGEVWQMGHIRAGGKDDGLDTAPETRRLEEGGTISPQGHTFIFRSRIGFELVFEYPAPGQMYKPGDLRRGWSAYEQPEGADRH